jgi:hypothetical protein
MAGSSTVRIKTRLGRYRYLDFFEDCLLLQGCVLCELLLLPRLVRICSAALVKNITIILGQETNRYRTSDTIPKRLVSYLDQDHTTEYQ